MRADTAVPVDALDVERIRQSFAPQLLGGSIYLYDAVPSTNTVLREMARAGAASGTVVLADSQTAGHGRAGQPWFSPPGVNLHASILLRPDIRPRAAGVYSFVASLAVADAIREQGLAPAIKWPNDVLVARRKVAGTLAEVAVAGGRVDHMILGVGVNVNVEPEALRAALGPAAQHATSLKDALGRPVDRSAFAAAFLTAVDEWLITAREQGPTRLLRAWSDLDVVTGRRVEVREGTAVFAGRARGIDPLGRLEVVVAHGVVRRVEAGDVRLLD